MIDVLAIIGAITLLTLTVVFISDALKRCKKRKAKEDYQRLAHGTPKVIKTVLTEVELWKHSDKPIMIDGEVYKRSYYDGYGWHCNQEVERLVNVRTGEEISLHLTERYLSTVVSVMSGKYPNHRYKRCNRFAVVMEVY